MLNDYLIAHTSLHLLLPKSYQVWKYSTRKKRHGVWLWQPVQVRKLTISICLVPFKSSYGVGGRERVNTEVSYLICALAVQMTTFVVRLRNFRLLFSLYSPQFHSEQCLVTLKEQNKLYSWSQQNLSNFLFKCSHPSIGIVARKSTVKYTLCLNTFQTFFKRWVGSGDNASQDLPLTAKY